MNLIQRKIYLYNVTFGLYMLDWWERYLFRCFGVVRYVQHYTLLFRALKEAFDMKTGLVSRTVEHEKPGTSKGMRVLFQFLRRIPHSLYAASPLILFNFIQRL